ncbi:MAG: hypothetical protein AAF487_11225 [Bacteroidota bacterium]
MGKSIILGLLIVTNVLYGQDCQKELLHIYEHSLQVFENCEKAIHIKYSVAQKRNDNQYTKEHFQLISDQSKQYFIAKDFGVFANDTITICISEKDSAIYIGKTLSPEIKSGRVKNMLNVDYRIFDQLNVERCERLESGEKKLILSCPIESQELLGIQQVTYVFDPTEKQIMQAHMVFEESALIQETDILIEKHIFDSTHPYLKKTPLDFILNNSGNIQKKYEHYEFIEIGTGRNLVQGLKNKKTS